MSSLNVKSLIGKLNDTCRQSLEAAAGLCMSRTNYNVELEHWLLKLVENPNSDLRVLLKHWDIDSSRVIRDLTKAIDRFKTGNSRPPALAPQVMDLAREGWLLASIDYGVSKARSAHLLLALVADDQLSRLMTSAVPDLSRISVEAFRKELPELIERSPESELPSGDQGDAAAASGTPQLAGANSKTPALDQYTIDLTQRAKAGHIDPVLGRDSEIRQVIDILSRRRQNNPILTGEAGVGKTAVAEGFALKIAAGDVPPSMQNVSLRTLDLGLLQAGAGMKGEFENRLKQVLDEVKKSPKPIILFIDEAHTLIGAGGAAGQGDAANMLKPALARGELRTIAATTWAEYKKYFERDAALARRFQVVKVEEPTEPVAVHMMRGLVETLEGHHKIRVLDEAVVEAVRLSNRFISGRQLPDKSISLLDTACARVAISHSATPSAVEDCQRTIEQLISSIGILEREMAAGSKHDERLTELRELKAKAEADFAALNARWKAELELVKELRHIREQLSQGVENPTAPWADAKAKGGTADAKSAAPVAPPVKLTDEAKAKLSEKLTELTAKLAAVQGETPLMQVCVDAQAIAEVVSSWTGIPAGRMVADEIHTILNLKQKLEERIIGQSHALEAISQAIRTSRANLTDPRKPIGVFLLVGTSGVGKTETAIALAELLYGGDQNMTVINMSEFKEEHKVSLLMGSPPGYVGYGEGGVLTEAVRRKPYSVVLLDEMEKAHPGVQDVFYQVFDKGMLRDGEGRDIDFKNTIILMTSNAATDMVLKLCADPETRPDPEALAETLHPELLKTFKPAFLGRATIVPYYPLADDVMRKIIELQLGRIKRRVRDSYRADFTYSPELVGSIADRCKEVHTGARTVEHILTRTLLPELSAEFLSRMANGEPITKAHVNLGPDGNFVYEIC